MTANKLRSYKDQQAAIKNFLEELARLEKKYCVYVDGWYLTGRYREGIDTKHDWNVGLQADEQDRG